MHSISSPPSCPPQWGTQRTDRRTYGTQVGVIAKALGTPLMPWQQQLVDVALEIDDETGRLAYREVVVTVPRQSGKTTMLLAVMTWRALAWPDQRITYTAQSGKDARLKWEDDQVPALERSPLANKFTVRKTNGSEAIRWFNGSLHTVISPTDTAGHGTQCDHATVDEAFHLPDHRLEQGLKPAMITREQPQLWIVSTAGTAASTYLKSKVDRGRDAVRDERTSGLAYFEWSAPADADPSDPATWWACIPSLGHTVVEEAIAAEQASMEPAEFERAYLNRWTSQVMASKIPQRSWEACVSDRSPGTDDIVFALDVSPDRSVSSIAVSDGAVFELADRRAGTEWVVSRCVQLWDQYRPVAVVVDAVGPASTLVPDLEAAGIRVEVTSHRQMAAACGRLYDAIVNRQVCHTDQADMNAAVAAAATRKLGDAWAWSRSASSVDISPLVAATLALWGATTLEREAEPVSPPVFAY
jgi:hypothetical protein